MPYDPETNQSQTAFTLADGADELVVGTDVRDLIPYLYDDEFISNARVESDAAGLGISIRNA